MQYVFAVVVFRQDFTCVLTPNFSAIFSISQLSKPKGDNTFHTLMEMACDLLILKEKVSWQNLDV